LLIFKKPIKQLVYLTENKDWVIKFNGNNIIKNMPVHLHPKMLSTYSRFKNKILHFGSKHLFFNSEGFLKPHHSNKVALSWYHVNPKDKDINTLDRAMENIDILHTSCTLTFNTLIYNGAPKNKTVLIPLGVDTKIFKPPTLEETVHLKRKLGIPGGRVCIGSFQKDGDGWEEGNDPKMIKGPDILCDVLEELNQEFPIHVLLTGPSRGYVRNRLNRSNIPFTYHYAKNPQELVEFYKVLDLYIVSSRIEGGPLAVLETMACGIPLVTTNVGLVPDVIKNGVNGFIADKIDKTSLVNLAKKVIQMEDKDEYRRISRSYAEKYDWKIIAEKYYTDIYSKLLSE